MTLTYKHNSPRPAPRSLFLEAQAHTATTNIRGGTPHPHYKLDSLSPPRIHRSRRSPIEDPVQSPQPEAREHIFSAPSEINNICTSARRAEGKVNLHNISQELADRVRMKKWFLQSSVASSSDGSVDSALKKLSLFKGAADEGLAYSRDEELRSSPLVPSLDEAPFARLGFDESDTNGEDETEDGMDEAQKIWRAMEVRKYGSGVGGALGGRSFSPT